MPSDSAVLCRKKRGLPPLPKINTNIASGSDNSSPPRIMQHPPSRNERINRWLLPVSPGFGVPGAVTMGSPVTLETPTAPVAAPTPITTASLAAPASTGNTIGRALHQAQPYGRSSVPNTPFQHPSFPRIVSPLPFAASQVAQAQAQATVGMNREKMLLEQYRYPGVQQNYQPPHCAPYPIVGRTAYTNQPMLPRTGFPIAYTRPPTTPMSFKFDPKAPEFRPLAQKHAGKDGKTTQTTSGPFVVGR